MALTTHSRIRFILFMAENTLAVICLSEVDLRFLMMAFCACNIDIILGQLIFIEDILSIFVFMVAVQTFIIHHMLLMREEHRGALFFLKGVRMVENNIFRLRIED